MRLGIDIGSTTIKYVVLDDEGRCIDQDYQRHSCQITEKLIEVLQKVSAKYNQPAMALAVSGSAAMGLQEKCSLPFVQEVYATRIAATKTLSEVDCIIELGGTRSHFGEPALKDLCNLPETEDTVPSPAYSAGCIRGASCI